MTDIRKNFFYSAFLTSANYIFPLLTFPYVTRVLGATNYGICSFIDSVINYFILFASMGIAVVGIREIARAKRDNGLLGKTYCELLSVNAIFTVVSIIVLIICTFTVPKLYEQKELMFFGAFKVGFNFLLIEWFYKGLEDFRFITMRSLVVKCFYVGGVFCFVRTSSDYPVYYLLSVLMVAVNAFINVVYSRKFVRISFHKVALKRYLRPLVSYGVYAILTSFYTTFNVAYLGFVSTDEEVGYYSTATRLYAIFIAMVSAFTGVMMPRMSYLLSENRIEEFKAMYSKSVDVLASVTIPVVIFTIMMTPQIVLLLAGEGYEGAILPMRVVMPLLFIIGYEQIMIVQGLMPLKKDKVVLRNSIWGALIGITANVILVSRFAAVGSAMVWLLCEFFIMILSQIAIMSSVGETFPLKVVIKNLIAYLPLIVLYWVPRIIDINNFWTLVITGIPTLVYFLFVQFYFFPKSICGKVIRKIVYKIM